MEICLQHSCLAVESGTNWTANVMLILCLLCKRQRERERDSDIERQTVREIRDAEKNKDVGVRLK